MLVLDEIKVSGCSDLQDVKYCCSKRHFYSLSCFFTCCNGEFSYWFFI